MDEQQLIINSMKKRANKKIIEGIECILVAIFIFFILLYCITHETSNNIYAKLSIMPFFICPIIYVSLGVSSYRKGKKLLKELETINLENEKKE